MNVEHLEVLVEEPSMEAALRLLLPKMLTGVSYNVHPYQGKQDLLRQLPTRLRGYAPWLPETWRVLVVVDRDDDDCTVLKSELEQMARAAGMPTRSSARGSAYKVINRLAIEELEAWYFGDWQAVRAAYPRLPRTVPNRAGYRDPDRIRGGTWEALERLLQRAGYFKGGLRKIEAARSIARHMDPGRNTSRSFQVLHSALVGHP